MKLLFKSKDGGPDSNVTGYWLIEWKKYFSVVLLRFDFGSRECYHNHAFNAYSWVLSGMLREECLTPLKLNFYKASFVPIYTSRSRLHKVFGMTERTWVLSFRGPWAKTWNEYSDKFTTLTNGRIKVE